MCALKVEHLFSCLRHFKRQKELKVSLLSHLSQRRRTSFMATIAFFLYIFCNKEEIGIGILMEALFFFSTVKQSYYQAPEIERIKIKINIIKPPKK